MPNWCMNKEYIIGPINEIQNLLRLLEQWTSKSYTDNGFGDKWIGNIVHYAGFQSLSDDEKHGLSCRGEITSYFIFKKAKVTDEVKKHYPSYEAYISFDSMTAWNSFPETWFAILKKHAPHCNYIFISEEPGMAEYYSNDIHHVFFKNKKYRFYTDEELMESFEAYLLLRKRLFSKPTETTNSLNEISNILNG